MFIRNAKFSVEQTLLMYPQIKKDVHCTSVMFNSLLV